MPRLVLERSIAAGAHAASLEHCFASVSTCAFKPSILEILCGGVHDRRFHRSERNAVDPIDDHWVQRAKPPFLKTSRL
ncbi:hypothetical protein Pla52o_12580 [Novipirellula galeiformis]|uniref:Uncharacterized protein n=1 Tax=Novipirellula galeiformis TaxID=2528004 RepID=A0A5C6CNK4_9BACT|nr:hypothetical protein Pla52o_12580 [Novipirellula galeiformis]